MGCFSCCLVWVLVDVCLGLVRLCCFGYDCLFLLLVVWVWYSVIGVLLLLCAMFIEVIIVVGLFGCFDGLFDLSLVFCGDFEFGFAVCGWVLLDLLLVFVGCFWVGCY